MCVYELKKLTSVCGKNALLTSTLVEKAQMLIGIFIKTTPANVCASRIADFSPNPNPNHMAGVGC